MIFKNRLLLFAIALCAATAATVSFSYAVERRAQNASPNNIGQSAQMLQEEDPESTPANIIDRAIYLLDDPALQFVYAPSKYVIEPFAESSANEGTVAPISTINIWSKADFLTLKNAGDEVGDFSPRLTVSIYGNSEGISLEDWIVGLPDAVIERADKAENRRSSDGHASAMEPKSIAGQAGITFARGDLLTYYQSTVLKDATGDKVIMISVGGPRDLAQLEGGADYYAAFDEIASSLRLTNASMDEYKPE